jgi:SSS family transporter
MFTHSAAFLFVLLAYFALILGIGIRGARKTHTEDDFLSAGRSIGPWVGGAVLAATQISAGTLVGTVGRHYATGVDWVWIWPGIWLGWLVSALFVGPKLREFGALTIPDYLAARFESNGIRVVSAIFIILVYMVLLVAQYQACGVIFEAIFGIPPVLAMCLLVLSTLLYTMLGGVRSSSYIDFLQIFIIITGLLLAVAILLHHFGGLTQAGRFLWSMDPRLVGGWYDWKQLFGISFALGFSIAAAPYEMVRFYSMKDKATVRFAIGICFVLQALIGSAVMIMGLMIRSIFPALPSADQASSIMAGYILPSMAGSLFVVALVSAIMSNVNSVLLVSSAGVSHDIYGRFINPHATEQRRLLISRVSIAALSLVPIWFALQRMADIQSIVVMAMRLVASFFFVPVVLGLNLRLGSSAGALSAMLGGFLACLLWANTAGRSFPSIDAAELL